MELVFKEFTEDIIGAAIEVHKSLGPGYLESIYEEAFAVELGFKEIPFERQKTFQIRHRGQLVGIHRMDFIIHGLVVVELKSVDNFDGAHFAQLKSYLTASGEIRLTFEFQETYIGN
ncbi:MAG TPA: GxxExxY protein [Acidobacteriota bacterium]|jgi:GxxExxY protein